MHFLEDKDKQFTFDYAYDPNSLQDQVFHDLGEPMINQALKGYNGRQIVKYIIILTYYNW